MNDLIHIQNIPAKESIEYFIRCFDSGKILDSEPLRIRFLQGSFYAFVPSPQDPKRLINFRSGGITEPGPLIRRDGHLIQYIPDTAKALASFLAKEIKSLKSPVLYLNEAMYTEADLTKFGTPYIKIEESIYFLFADGLDDVDQLEKKIRQSTQPWHFLGFLLDSSVPMTSNKELWRQARMIIVGAYDGEGYLYWTPGQA